MNPTGRIDSALNSVVTRRAFARRGIFAGLAAAGAAAVGSLNLPVFAQSTFVDADILQFALNLEYLEAEFYTVAVTGLTLKQSGFTTGFSQGAEGDTVGGGKVALSGNVLTAAQAIMRDEQAHVRLLQGALGGRAISKPAINLAALGLGFNSQNEFLILSRAFEDVGVTAYGGAAPLIRDGKILGTAARILATEAEHVGIIRELIAQTTGIAVPALDDQDILPMGSTNGRLVSADDNGLTAVRTPSQVLNIVYAGDRFRGGFFPAGVNGAFNSVTSL
ncbi:MAG: Dessication-associated protein [Acidobacteria bacterium]|nr:Dessication-associated protein [Acidobacteriota bacterium]